MMFTLVALVKVRQRITEEDPVNQMQINALISSFNMIEDTFVNQVFRGFMMKSSGT